MSSEQFQCTVERCNETFKTKNARTRHLAKKTWNFAAKTVSVPTSRLQMWTVCYERTPSSALEKETPVGSSTLTLLSAALLFFLSYSNVSHRTVYVYIVCRGREAFFLFAPPTHQGDGPGFSPPPFEAASSECCERGQPGLY